MLLAGALHHGVADLHADTVRRQERGDQMTRFTAKLEDPLMRLDNELQRALEQAVEVAVGVNPFVAAPGNGTLLRASGFMDFCECVRTPILRRANFRIGGNHRHYATLLWRAWSWVRASVIPGASCKAARYAPY